jgi:hypothetical protein
MVLYTGLASVPVLVYSYNAFSSSTVVQASIIVSISFDLVLTSALKVEIAVGIV